MNIKIIASGSKGNCYLLESGEVRILLDCGIPFAKIQRAMNYELPQAVFVTHEHADHIKAAQEFLARGVNVYMTIGTAMAAGIEKRHNLKFIEDDEAVKVGGLEVEVFTVKHDATEPVNFIISDVKDRILYLTDCGAIPEHLLSRNFTKLLLEANFDEQTLFSTKSEPEWLNRRIYANHLSFNQARAFVRGLPDSNLSEVYLIHISSRTGDEGEFKRLMQSFVDAKVYTISDFRR